MIFAAIFALYGRQTTTARVDAVQPDSAAAAAGLKPGDVVLAIDGRAIESFSDMQRIVSANAGRTLHVPDRSRRRADDADRDAALKQGKDGFGNNFCHAVLGVSRSMTPTTSRPSTSIRVTAVWLGAKETWFIIDRTFSYIGGLFAGPNAPTNSAGRSGSHRSPARSPRSASCRCCIWPPCCRFRSAY